MVLNDICEFIVDCPHSTAPNEGEGYPIIRTPTKCWKRTIDFRWSSAGI